MEKRMGRRDAARVRVCLAVRLCAHDSRRVGTAKCVLDLANVRRQCRVDEVGVWCSGSVCHSCDPGRCVDKTRRTVWSKFINHPHHMFCMHACESRLLMQSGIILVAAPSWCSISIVLWRSGGGTPLCLVGIHTTYIHFDPRCHAV